MRWLLRHCRGACHLGALGVAIVACGGAGAGRRGEVSERCEGAATCERVELRGALAATGLDDGRIVIAGYDSRRRALVVGVARGPRWEPESLGLHPVAQRAGLPLAMARDASGVALVFGASQPPSVRLARLELRPAPRLVSERVLATGLPGAVALGSGGDAALWAAWVDAEGTVHASSATEGAGAPAALLPLAAQRGGAIAIGGGGSTTLARASAAGVETIPLPAPPGAEPILVSHAPAMAVAMRGEHLVWTDGDGVHHRRLGASPDAAPQLVDDGSRAGEPAHRVGASLAIDVCADGTPLLAYQDQSAGALIAARIGPNGAARQQHLDRRWTAGMRIAVACPVVLDLSARAPPLRTALRAR